MAKARSKLPSYRHHKASGQACVKLSGRTIYLGPHGTRLSRDNYDRVVSEWLAAGRTFPQDNGSHVVTIAEVLLAFNNSNAIPPSQRHSYKSVMKIIARLYGTTAVEDFGPRALLAVQEQMIRAGWNRQTCNTRLYLARRIFKWGVSRQLVPAGVYEALKTVDGLEARLEAAPEPKAVQAVAVEHVEACLPFMSPTVAAMVKLQMHTGMRPGEVVQLRTCDVDASGDVWIYNPAKHKTQHLGKARPIAIGPKGIEILRPWLRSDLNAYVFSPADAERERRERLSAMRKTPLNQGNRVGSNRSKRPHTAPSEKYTVATYRQAIYRSCERAFPPPAPLARAPGETVAAYRARLTALDRVELAKWRAAHFWHPHRLRHYYGTLAETTFDREHTSHALGHSNLSITGRYTRAAAIKKAVEVAKAIG